MTAPASTSSARAKAPSSSSATPWAATCTCGTALPRCSRAPTPCCATTIATTARPSACRARSASQTLARDAAALIEREAGGEPVHFVGLSMGGMTAQALAAERPELLRSVAIANSSAHYPDQAPWRARAETVARQASRPSPTAPWSAGSRRASWPRPKARRPRAALHDMLVRNDAQAYIDSCAAVAAIDFRESNRRIAVPTLVIAGAQDLATPPAMSEAIVAAIPGARLATIDAAHVSAVERPASSWRC